MADVSNTADGAQTFVLNYPVKDRTGAQISQLSARRPRVRDLREFVKRVDADAVGAIQKVLADLTEVQEQIIADLDITDFKVMREWFEAFFADTSNA